MTQYLINIFYKIKFLIATDLLSKTSSIIFDSKTKVRTKAGSKIIVKKGILKIGGSLPNSVEIPSLNSTQIILEENSTLVIEDDVFIASGTFLNVKKNATLIFKGKNYIGHNNIFICHKDFKLGRNSSTSWNVTIFDHDGHNLFLSSGKKFKTLYRPIEIDDNVGIQMNVTIPRGLKIGKNSLIGANTVLREDIEQDTLAYQDLKLRKKNGISAGLQFC